MAIGQLNQEAPALEAKAVVPPLENGDRLTRMEFERRYEAMPHLKKAELVEGVVYLGSPVRIEAHGQPHGFVLGWLTYYWEATPGVQFADNTTVRLDPDNEPQPDALLRLDAAVGGASRITEDGYLEGPPELVIEVAASSVSIDRHEKLRAYRRNGVREYIIWRVLDRQLDWFALQEGDYVRLEPDDRGVVHSTQFPGLRLAVATLLEGDWRAALAEQQAGLGSPEHRQFVEALAARAGAAR